VVDGLEGLAEVVGEVVGGGDRVLTGVDLNGAVSARGLYEFPDRAAGLRLDPAADGERGEHNGEMGLDGVALAVVDLAVHVRGLRCPGGSYASAGARHAEITIAAAAKNVSTAPAMSSPFPVPLRSQAVPRATSNAPMIEATALNGGPAERVNRYQRKAVLVAGLTAMPPEPAIVDSSDSGTSNDGSLLPAARTDRSTGRGLSLLGNFRRRISSRR
jgi:hypothetical protein